MTTARPVPLRRKLTWLTMTCSVVALLTTAVALGAYEWFSYRRTLYRHLETMSTIAARNSSAALAFASPEDARRILAALETEPAITAAALYDAQGRRFAAFRPDARAADLPEVAPADGIRTAGTELFLALPVREEKRFGTLLVRADVRLIRERLLGYLVVLAGTTALSGLLAFLLTGWLTRRLVAPVQALAAAATGVKTKADYSVRVERTDDDELGQLTDAFNEMLARVQENESALYRNAERLRLAVAAAQIGTWDWNLVRDEVMWNDRNYEIFGMPAGLPVNSRLFFSVVHPDDRPRVRMAIETAVSTTTDFSVEFRLARPERPPHYVLVRGLFLKSSAGDPLRAVGVTMDVTEARGAELRVLESERRFRAVAERAPALIWSCDTNLQRDYFNKTWLNFTGRNLDAELGSGWQAGVPEADVARWHEVVGTAARQRDPYSIEYRLRRADGAFRWVIETGSARLAADGSFAGYLGSCIDITTRKVNEAELEAHVKARTRELEIANQELESFPYSVSHDLRGPVRAIQGFAEIAIEECEAGNGAAAVERLHRVIKAAERMNKLIDAVIGMARISRAEPVIETVNLTRMAEEIMGFLRSAAAVPRAVEVMIAPDLECQGDERLLRIVLENLLGNAWKFTARVPSPRIEFGTQLIDDQRVFFVRDNGAGFKPALAHKLFHAFERLHDAAQFEGLGVGLNTVQRVIEKHAGRVWAEGSEGKGATFYFTVKVGEPAPVVAGAGSGSGFRIHR
jgi:PAS domain S-box-containing protein